MAPVITPFEANLAFSRYSEILQYLFIAFVTLSKSSLISSVFGVCSRGSEWTGAYLMHFQDVINSSKLESEAHSEPEEPRFSFFQGGYVEDHNANGNRKAMYKRVIYLSHWFDE